jgi:methylglyoxal synthase
MELTEIASLSGKSGLFRVLKPTKAGVILESLDESKIKLVASASQKLSLLKEISIYTTSQKGTVSLEEVLRKIHTDFGNELGVTAESGAVKLKAFIKAVIPDYDELRVYVSDIKKLVRWYQIIALQAPEVLKSAIQQEGEVKEG